MEMNHPFTAAVQEASFRNLSLTKLWNNSLILEDKELKPREYCRASELGKSIVDRYLIMKGVRYTNPPNDRSKRKFFAGRIWEWVAGLILNQLGIIQNKQIETSTQDMPLEVIGHLDYLVGGRPDYGKARRFITSLPFDEETIARFMKVIENFEIEYGSSQIETVVHEIKSCSHFVIEKIETGGSIPGHELQLDHYVKGTGLRKGIIDYISKDDALMAERLIYRDAERDKLLHKDLSVLKGHLDANEMPPPDGLIIFDSRFQKNLSVEYSTYLTMVYGFETPEQYRDSVQGKISSWNRVLNRIKQISSGQTTPTGKQIKLTDKNKLAVDEMARDGWNAYDLAKVALVEEEEEPTFE